MSSTNEDQTMDVDKPPAPPPAASPEAKQRPAKKRRSRFGCNTCRARKVKCDERPNGCANCERLHLECSGYNLPSLKSNGVAKSPSRTGAKRTYRSCDGCRIARSKCSGERPVCAACREKHVRCSYEDAVDRPTTASTGRSDAPSLPDQSQNGSSPENLSPWENSAQPTNPFAGSPLTWLNAPDLPDMPQILVLANQYFAHFHPLRCFAFIHKPTFFRKLDEQTPADMRKNAMLQILCAIGAQYHALEYSTTTQALPPETIRAAGSHWAKTALRLILDDVGTISVENLMASQLLYDYELRMANWGRAFMLSALMIRMTQALQINLEYSVDMHSQEHSSALSVTTRECRRRLMWSCYITDVLCGSGVDQLMLIDEKDVKIQLPCNDRSFLQERSCVTRTLNGSVLAFLPPDTIPADPDENMGMLAYFVQHMEIRKRVLRYIKHLDKAKLPWLPNSEFATLNRGLQSWYESLPSSLRYNTAAIYIRKESNQLGALSLLHLGFHQTMCDLYRLGVPSLYKLRSAFHFPPEQHEFLRHLQWTIFEEARAMAAILAEAARHGPAAVGDTWLPTLAYDSIRIMLFYLTQVIDADDHRKKEIVLETIPYIQSNLNALKAMRLTNAVADGLARAAESMLEKLGITSNSILPYPNIVLNDPYLARLDQTARDETTPPQSAPDYVLNPLSIFRMARRDIPEKHAPEGTIKAVPNTPRLRTLSIGNGERPRLHNVMDRRGSAVGSTGGDHQTPGGSSTTMSAAHNTDMFGINLDMFFDPNLEWDWEPAETLMAGTGMEGEGLLPWVGASQQPAQQHMQMNSGYMHPPGNP